VSAETVVALALGFGVLAQAAAALLRIPSIVLLFGAGLLLGPDGAGWIQPQALGAGLFSLVSLAVAVILFEGALNLDLRRLRREARAIRALVTTGALITWVGAACAARFLLGWGWELSLLFGAIAIVTGPTVIGPLLRSLRVKSSVATVLEAEGVLIDPIGAIVAALTLEAVLAPDAGSLAATVGGLLPRLALGAAAGATAGALMAFALRRRLLPEGLESLFVLAAALVTYAVCNALLSESGILAVVAAGVALANLASRLPDGLREFKGTLTEGLIGLLFVLLAADVGIREMAALGAAGLATVAALMFAVRPASVLACTLGSSLTWRERAFVAWLGPRGIVAAAVASLGAAGLTAHGHPGGEALRALVFLTIATTVVVLGGLGGVVARILRVNAPERRGMLVLGADRVGLALAEELRGSLRPVTLLDANPDHCREAEEGGWPVVYGNALDERTLARARPEQAGAVIGLTSNESVNLLFAREASARFAVPQAYVALERGSPGLPSDLLARHRVRVLFDGPRDVERWNVRFRHGLAERVRVRFEPPTAGAAPAAASGLDPFLMLTHERGGRVEPMHQGVEPKQGDEAVVALLAEQKEAALAALAARGWRLAAPGAPAPPAAGAKTGVRSASP
jgi:NhaP-type Na+/H+ or K+/H+ antiporter